MSCSRDARRPAFAVHAPALRSRLGYARRGECEGPPGGRLSPFARQPEGRTRAGLATPAGTVQPGIFACAKHRGGQVKGCPVPLRPCGPRVEIPGGRYRYLATAPCSAVAPAE